ncbi:MAG: Helix-turn-helix domain [Myxococcales bacterium]|nr:Helix-turn-helix domain [Myxococcales bacterium]
MTANAYVDTESLAAELGLSLSTLRNWRRLAQGPAWIRIGRQVRYARVAVDAWLAAQTVGGAA